MKPRGKRRLFDILLIAFLLVLTAVFYFLFSADREQGGWAVVTVNGKEVARYALSAEGTYSLNGGSNTMVIEDGMAWLIEADCPDKICIGMGKIRYNGQSIVCLPNRLVISIEGGEEGADIFSG